MSNTSKTTFEKSCLNCDHEYSCSWEKEMLCVAGDLDLDTKKEMQKKKRCEVAPLFFLKQHFNFLSHFL